jgi:hypothetical protein
MIRGKGNDFLRHNFSRWTVQRCNDPQKLVRDINSLRNAEAALVDGEAWIRWHTS